MPAASLETKLICNSFKLLKKKLLILVLVIYFIDLYRLTVVQSHTYFNWSPATGVLLFPSTFADDKD